MIHVFRPSESKSKVFWEAQRGLPFSYLAVGQTQTDEPVTGFDNDYHSAQIGTGDQDWELACAAIRAWKMFPGTWVAIWPAQTPIQEGERVLIHARVCGLWWSNACRIVYVIDTPTQFGFAYGTLPGHVECGEERFLVEKKADGTILYTIKVFSRPLFWMARVGYPIARFYQRKFVAHSQASMRNFVKS